MYVVGVCSLPTLYRCTAVNELSKEMKREELLMLLEGLSYGDMRRKKRYKFG
jgi:hypothetical protein